LAELEEMLKYVTSAELDELELLYRAADDASRDLSPDEQRRVIEISTAATQRQLAGRRAAGLR
jgi:hypothetical protein